MVNLSDFVGFLGTGIGRGNRRMADPINFDILLIVQFSSVLVTKVLFECIFVIFKFM